MVRHTGATNTETASSAYGRDEHQGDRQSLAIWARPFLDCSDKCVGLKRQVQSSLFGTRRDAVHARGHFLGNCEYFTDPITFLLWR